MKIELPILWNTEETYQLELSGIKVEYHDMKVRMVTFYHIDVIAPNLGYGSKQCCSVYSCGEEWVCSMTYDEVKKEIDKRILEYE